MNDAIAPAPERYILIAKMPLHPPEYDRKAREFIRQNHP
jgi:hypothetical protein